LQVFNTSFGVTVKYYCIDLSCGSVNINRNVFCYILFPVKQFYRRYNATDIL